MRTTQQRVEKYNARTTSALYGTAFGSVIALMKANYTAHANEIVPIQQAIKDILDTQGVTVPNYFGYYAFGNEMFRAAHNASGESLAMEAQSLIGKYAGFGLSCSILEQIRTDVFSTGDPASPGDYFAGPVLKTPDDEATGVALTSDLEWHPVPGAASYNVYLEDANPPTVLLGNVSQPDPLAIVSLTTGLLPASTEHFWYVVAQTACGQTGTSEIRSFTTGT